MTKADWYCAVDLLFFSLGPRGPNSQKGGEGRVGAVAAVCVPRSGVAPSYWALAMLPSAKHLDGAARSSARPPARRLECSLTASFVAGKARSGAARGRAGTPRRLVTKDINKCYSTS